MGSNPSVPKGVVPDSGYDKRDSTTPDRKTKLSPARPNTREWASASYGKEGWARNFDDGGGQRQVPSAGKRTKDNQSKPSTMPGRW